MNATTPDDAGNADEKRRFAHFMVMCASAGSDPFQVGGIDAETLAKLQKKPHLRHNGEVLFLAEGATAEPQGMIDRVLEGFAKERNEGIGWAVVKCFGARHYQRSESGAVTQSEPGPATGSEGAAPEGVVISKQTFKLRVIGIPSEELKTLAIELGRRLGETEVYIRRFNADEWDVVNIK